MGIGSYGYFLPDFLFLYFFITPLSQVHYIKERILKIYTVGLS